MRWEALSKTASAPVWTRRRLLVGGLAGLAGFFLAGGRRFARAEPAAAFGLPAATRDALRTSPLVYVSPLQTDGSESRCHGEVWYCTDQGSVMIVTSADGWKAKAVGKGLHRARLWVGDFGAVRSAGGDGGMKQRIERASELFVPAAQTAAESPLSPIIQHFSRSTPMLANGPAWTNTGVPSAGRFLRQHPKIAWLL